MKYVTFLCTVGYLSCSFFYGLSMERIAINSDVAFQAYVISCDDIVELIDQKSGINLKTIAHNLKVFEDEQKIALLNLLPANLGYMQDALDFNPDAAPLHPLATHHLDDISNTFGFTSGKAISEDNVNTYLAQNSRAPKVILNLNDCDNNPYPGILKAIGKIVRNDLDNQIPFFGILFAHKSDTNQLLITSAPAPAKSSKRAFGTADLGLIISGLQMLDQQITNVADQPTTSPEAKACLKRCHSPLLITIVALSIASVIWQFWIGISYTINQYSGNHTVTPY